MLYRLHSAAGAGVQQHLCMLCDGGWSVAAAAPGLGASYSTVLLQQQHRKLHSVSERESCIAVAATTAGYSGMLSKQHTCACIRVPLRQSGAHMRRMGLDAWDSSAATSPHTQAS